MPGIVRSQSETRITVAYRCWCGEVFPWFEDRQAHEAHSRGQERWHRGDFEPPISRERMGGMIQADKIPEPEGKAEGRVVGC